MRIWHYKLIPYLPKKQLLAMRYELGDMIKQYPNIKNSLVKYANGYSPIFLLSYFGAVCSECEKRGFNCSSDYNDNIFVIGFEKNNQKDIVSQNYTFKEHNYRYLKQCLYNLEEKADRNVISKEEWQVIKDNFDID